MTSAAGNRAVATSTSSGPELVELALAAASLPAVAYVTESSEANLRWAANTLTTNGEMRSRSLTVVATSEVPGGVAVGTVSRQIAGPEDVPDVVAAAEAAARTGPPSAEASPLVEDYPHDEEWTEAPAGTSVDVLAAAAGDLGAMFQRAAADDIRLYGFAEHVVTTTYLGGSSGLRRRGVQPTGRLELNAKSDAGGSAWAGTATRDFAGVDVPARYAELARRLEWGRNRIDLPPGRYETLLPPGPVADLMIYLYWSAGAQDAEEGRSVFAAPGGGTRIGERLTPLPVSLRSDPTHPGLECVPFVDFTRSSDGASWAFDLGLPAGPVDWMADGVLSELVRNRARAARTGRAVTPPVDNLIMDAGGTASLEEMIARTERGLLLTCMWYIREVDPERLLLTGLTRDGVYLIENGEVVGAVNNFRFNESPVELLGRVTEIGRSQPVLCREWNDFFNRTQMPPIRVPDFNMSTVSQAS